MNRYVLVVQNNLKKSSGSVFTFLWKFFSGLIVGLTLALIGQEVMQYGNLLFTFVTIMTVIVFMSIARSWNVWTVGIFNLVCVLLGLLLRMYALVAPGA